MSTSRSKMLRRVSTDAISPSEAPPPPEYEGSLRRPSTLTMRAIVEDEDQGGGDQIDGFTPRVKMEEPPPPSRQLVGASPTNDEYAPLPSSEGSRAVDDQAHRCVAKLKCATSGLLTVALVDQASGTSIHAIGSTADLELAVSGGAELLALKMDLLERVNLAGSLEDIVVITGVRLYIIHPLDRQRFLYVIVDREIGNLALARRFVSSAAAELLA